MPHWLTVTITVGVMWLVIGTLVALAVCWWCWGKHK
jgi:uncharacterized membrane protein